jgi:hypothetical protein
LKEVQEALGHQTIAMTMRYAHLAPDHLRAAVSSLDNILPPTDQAQDGRKDIAPSTHLAGSNR